jgi:hypothetical protein
MDADEMRLRAVECRLFAKRAAPTVVDAWVKAAVEWELLARELDAFNMRAAIIDATETDKQAGEQRQS